ncbi:hypothetical protein IAG44_28875 [Streptomyces roseirectus]|uniref:Uncharacterized protein n=1 Tax=Streptomyces roseirectus TaxID=2768066 RepID=A0A7H0IJT3_9ACTN|nr:hypothetical protein [Streptomyces roseirectus]QNP73049.1 hypothetical protein IAG44_28875 [Streptomyces roseirectus]
MKGDTEGEGNQGMRQLAADTGEFEGAEVIALYGEDWTWRDAPATGVGAGARTAVRGCRAGWLLVGCGLVLLPWLYVLATELPATATAAHWPLAWVGLDALEAAGLIATGILAARGHLWQVLTAAATGTLLVVDAWFDTTTAAAGGDFATAVAMAVGVELPLAGLCGWLAVRALEKSPS